MSFNFGGFGLGFSDGFERGTRLAKSIKDTMKEARLQQIREQGLAEAKAAEAADKAAQDDGTPTGKPTVTSPDTEAKAPPASVGPQPDPEAAVKTYPVTPPGGANPVAPTATVPDSSAYPSPEPKVAPTASQPDATATPSPKPAPVDASLDGAPGAKPVPTTAPTSAATPDQPAPAAAEKPTAATPTASTTAATAGLPPPAAKRTGMSAHDYFMKNTAPQIRDEYLAQGNDAMAQQWDKYIESNKGKQAVNAWAKGMTKIMAGDWNSGIDAFGDYYTHHIDDGVSYAGKELVTDQSGQVTGANIKLKDSKGNVTSMHLDMATIQRMGAAWNPQALFEMNQKQLEEAGKQQAQLGLKKMEIAALDRRTGLVQDREDARKAAELQARAREGDANRRAKSEENKANRDGKLEEITLKSTLDAAGYGEKQKAEIAARADALKRSGYSQEFIDQQMPAILGIDQYKRQTSPEEARRLAFSDRMKSDPMFSRKKPEEQAAIIEGDMKLITGTGSAGGSLSAQPPDPKKPAAAAGLPPQPGAAPKPPAMPQYVRDKTNGAIYQVNPDGSKTLVKGAQDASGKPVAR